MFKSIQWNGNNALFVYNFLEDKDEQCGMNIKSSGKNFHIVFNNGTGNTGTLIVNTDCGEVKCNIGDYILKEENQFKVFSKLQYQLYRENRIKNEYLRLIASIGYDYDGSKSIEDFKLLVDTLVEYANKAMDNDDKSAIYGINSNKQFNILMEEVDKNEKC